MKIALALGSLSMILGTGQFQFQQALDQHDRLPLFSMSRLVARARQAERQSLRDVVNVMARQHGVKATLVQSIIRAESSFKPDAVSNKGAVGLMQLMPETAEEYGAKDPRNPEQNIAAGTKYLGWLLKRYEKKPHALPLAIAAYNAGPGNVDKYQGIPPFRETMTYVKRVLTYHRELEGLPPSEQLLPFVKLRNRRGKATKVALARRGRES